MHTRIRRRVCFLVLIAAWFGLVSPTSAGDRDRVPLGTVIEDLEFLDIRTLTRTLSELGECDAYVLVFTTTTCPLVQRYLPRLAQLHEEFADRVQFVAVNVGAGESVQAVAAHAIGCGAKFPFVKDRDGACADAVGAERTPEAVILDRNRRLVYRGRIDDQYRLGGALPEPRRHDLRAALEELLAGKPISVPATAVDGCRITRVEPHPMPEGTITYHRDVAPIVREKCVGCHQPGTAAPFGLETYDQVRRHGAMIAEVVELGRMPPWYANPNHGTFQNDRSLSPDQRRTILRWVESGMAEGEEPVPSTTPVPGEQEVRDGWTIGKPDLVVSMLFDHEVPAEGFVPYRYVVLPHVFVGETWIEAIEIRPDNRSVVHHANLAYGSPGHEPGLSSFITGYVPGGQAMDLTRFDNDVAFRIPRLSVLGLQVHYVTTGRPERSKISVGLRFKRGKVRKQLRFRLADPRRFAIPPHDSAHAVRKSFKLKNDVSILGFFAHMHLRGKDMTFLAHRPDGTTETLLQIPNYNFDWQHGYEVRAGDVRLPGGSRIEVVAHFDNSRFNPYNPDPSRTVRYGPQTVDEMMNGYVFFTRDAESLNLDIDPTTGRVHPARLAPADADRSDDSTRDSTEPGDGRRGTF